MDIKNELEAKIEATESLLNLLKFVRRMTKKPVTKDTPKKDQEDHSEFEFTSTKYTSDYLKRQIEVDERTEAMAILNKIDGGIKAMRMHNGRIARKIIAKRICARVLDIALEDDDQENQ